MNIRNSKQAHQKMPNIIININIILLKEMQVKSVSKKKHPYKPTILTKLKKTDHLKNIIVDVEEGKSWFTAGGNIKWYNQCGKLFGILFFEKKLNWNIPYDAKTATLGKSNKKQGIKYYKEINIL